jgi:hypothetical protein
MLAGAVLLTATVAIADPGRLVLVSISEAGVKGAQASYLYDLSGNGKKVGFASASTTQPNGRSLRRGNAYGVRH